MSNSPIFSHSVLRGLRVQNLSIEMHGQTQKGGFCEDRARYTFPARPLHAYSYLTPIMQDASGNLVNRDKTTEKFDRGKSLKEIAELQGKMTLSECFMLLGVTSIRI